MYLYGMNIANVGYTNSDMNHDCSPYMISTSRETKYKYRTSPLYLIPSIQHLQLRCHLNKMKTVMWRNYVRRWQIKKYEKYDVK